MTFPLDNGDVAPMRTIHRAGHRFPELLSRGACKDRNGVWRLKHSADKDGRCVFCDRTVAARTKEA